MGAIRPCQCAAPRQGWGSRLREKDARGGVREGRWGGAGQRRLLVGGWGSRRSGTGGSRTAPTTGSGGSDWGLGGGAPPGAPLGSCLRRNDARGGVREGRWWMWGGGGWGWRRGEAPAAAGRAVREPPLRGLGSGGSDGGLGGDAPPGAPLDTGFRRYDDGGVRSGGGVLVVGGCDGGRRRPAPAPLPWIPAFAGTTMGGCGVWRGLLVRGGPSTGSGRTDSGSARAMGSGGCDGEDGDAPCRAPLGSCLRRNDARGGVREGQWGGVWVGEGCWWRWGESPAAAGRAVREPPLRGLGSRGSDWGLGGGAPPGAPLDTGFRRYDDGGVWGCGGGCWWRWGPSTGSGRTDLGSARAMGSGGCDEGRRRPAPRPSGFLPSQE